MVGLVIVSHSSKLAEGVAELARGMAGPDVALAATGGLDLPDRPLGTDANLVLQAIEQVYSPDGVLVLMDLGSALLSAEMALDALTPERRAHILLCEAPLVEGAIAASVQARLGSPIEQVAAEARGALTAKAVHLGVTAAVPQRAAPEIAAGPAAEIRLIVNNRLGLHARPATRFVQTAGRFQSSITVQNLTSGRGPVSAKSINAVATLGVRQGHTILVIASGPDFEAALIAVQALASENFGDQDDGPTAAVAEATSEVWAPDALRPSAFRGLAASPGIAIGPARLFRPAEPTITQDRVVDPQPEWNRLLTAIDKTRAQIRATLDAVARQAGRYSAAIFEAHLLYLDDDALREPARRAVFDERLNAAAAWQRATNDMAAEYRALDDDYLRARAADVLDVGRQVILNLALQPAAGVPIRASGILLAADLAPADTAQLDRQLVLGIGTASGGSTSHSAILARALGIPAVVGLGDGILGLAEGTPLVLDGDNGQIIPRPDVDTIAEYTRRLEAARAAQAEARLASAAPAVTRDGRRIEIAANIGSAEDARAAVDVGAEGVGLFRTEFLFLDRRTAPDEAEQFEAYRAAAQAMDGRPIIIRTLDVGGDKPLPYLDLGHEANPFLGWRAIRMCLANPEFFKTQLRAIVRTAAEFPIRVMFPMIATLAEWRAARRLLSEAAAEVKDRGQPAPNRIEIGIMIEIPSAALRASQFAMEVDFFSIGTNDLSQYTLAAERGNARVAALADAYHPSVLQLIEDVVEAAHRHGKWAGVCGEMGGEPLAAPVLIGLGVDELSMSAPAIPRAKQIVRLLDYEKTRRLAQQALALEDAEAVKNLLNAAR